MPATLTLSSPAGADRVDVYLPLPDELRASGRPARRRARRRRAAHARADARTASAGAHSGSAPSPACARPARLPLLGGVGRRRASAARVSERRDAAHAARAARHAGVRRQPGLADARRRHRVRRHPRAGQPGDRVSSINWRASARRGELLVNEQHPERNTDVVLFLDTFTDVRTAAAGRSTSTVRAATSLAHRYLQRKDRVGVVSFGGYLSWLLPASGTRQLYRIVDSLLADGRRAELRDEGHRRPAAAHAAAEGARARAHAAPRRALGGGAARPARPRLRPRRDRGLPRAVRAPGERRARASSRTGCGGSRASRCELRYEQAGVPVVEWQDGEPLEVVLEEVTAFRRYARPARA